MYLVIFVVLCAVFVSTLYLAVCYLIKKWKDKKATVEETARPATSNETDIADLDEAVIKPCTDASTDVSVANTAHEQSVDRVVFHETNWSEYDEPAYLRKGKQLVW
ncbi:hypothetical protein [Azomonas macrocytogenes]|uniref:Uncharacterized protein YpmB n=1 Tax=Azomonas macrocytogenes TaxID=69962 RepID=A0A839T6U1_AZOMA|nr:hypothetical protein [Azomonas macrocytogenes]MBB3105162.1 uncharacterized protein YpmB [Azomonas macrocytogenes]